MCFSNEEYALFKNELFGDSMDTIWSAMRADNFGKETFSYSERRECFFYFIHRLMDDGEISISHAGSLLSGSIDEQIGYLNNIFPKNQEDMEDNAFDGFWFLSDNCLCSITWVHDNGHIV